jgi:hypothetical protein
MGSKASVTQDLGLSLAVPAESFRIEDHGVKLVMRRRNADIKKMIAMQRIGGDA